ncbi:hypothetical protein B7494_g787 [Chlorociboria aeruginascens]|nr:hypothetical protein B7494_g787 [Chlorociboria aeruginascens]
MRFLCLHGKGTNNKIFEMQTASIRFELGDHHTFEFLEGVLQCPLDEDLRAFSAVDNDQYFAYFKDDSPTSCALAVDQLRAFIEAEGPYDGVFAFSQGATIAATLLSQRTNSELPFKCAVFFSGLSAPDYDALKKGEIRMLDEAGILKLPTAHIWGKKDLLWSGSSERLSHLCDSGCRNVYLHEGSHEIPGPKLSGSVNETVKVIRRAIDQALLRQ